MLEIDIVVAISAVGGATSEAETVCGAHVRGRGSRCQQSRGAELAIVLTDDSAIRASTAIGAASTRRPTCSRFPRRSRVLGRPTISATS